MSDEKATISVVQGTYEPCEECGAPLDPQQRYCVNCAARRGNGANPASRYFAAMSKKARRPLTRPPAKAGPGSRAAAVAFFALLPVAVALGVVVGRGDSGGSDNEALLQALRQQEAAAATASTAGADPTATTAKTTKKAGKAEKGTGKRRGQSGRRDQERHRALGDGLQSQQREDRRKTPRSSQKTPNRRATTTSKPSRTSPT